MIHIAWDASGLVKRYAPEIGTTTVNELFAQVPLDRMVTTTLGFAETVSVLTRKRNRGELSKPLYAAALSAVDREILFAGQFNVLDIGRADIFAGISLIRAHNIGAADSALLAAFLSYEAHRALTGDTIVVVSSDIRLLRTAAAEGLQTIDPERLPAGDVATLLASLTPP